MLSPAAHRAAVCHGNQQRVTLPLPILLLLFPPFPGTRVVDLFLRWPHSNISQFAWWLTALRRWVREIGSVWPPLVALIRVATSLWGSFQTEVDSKTSVYQTLWSEWALHRHSLLVRTIAPIIRDSFRGRGVLVLFFLNIFVLKYWNVWLFLLKNQQLLIILY